MICDLSNRYRVCSMFLLRLVEFYGKIMIVNLCNFVVIIQHKKQDVKVLAWIENDLVFEAAQKNPPQKI